MLIPITIGYDGDNKVEEDLVNLNNLLVYLKDEQMDYFSDITKYSLIDDNEHICLYTLDYRLINKSMVVHNLRRLRNIYNKIKERNMVFKNENCKNICEYNNTHEKKMKHIVLLIFGYPSMGYPSQQEIGKIINLILLIKEHMGIHIINITSDISNMDLVIRSFTNRVSTRNDLDKTFFNNNLKIKLKDNELAYKKSNSDSIQILQFKRNYVLKRPTDYCKELRNTFLNIALLLEKMADDIDKCPQEIIDKYELSEDEETASQEWKDIILHISYLIKESISPDCSSSLVKRTVELVAQTHNLQCYLDSIEDKNSRKYKNANKKYLASADKRDIAREEYHNYKNKCKDEALELLKRFWWDLT